MTAPSSPDADEPEREQAQPDVQAAAAQAAAEYERSHELAPELAAPKPPRTGSIPPPSPPAAPAPEAAPRPPRRGAGLLDRVRRTLGR